MVVIAASGVRLSMVIIAARLGQGAGPVLDESCRLSLGVPVLLFRQARLIFIVVPCVRRYVSNRYTHLLENSICDVHCCVCILVTGTRRSVIKYLPTAVATPRAQEVQLPTGRIEWKKSPSAVLLPLPTQCESCLRCTAT